MSIEIRFSPMTLAVLALLHLLATMAILSLRLPGELSALLLLAVARSSFRVAREYGSGSSARVGKIHVSEQLALLHSAGGTLRCRLPRLLFLSEFLTVLEFSPELGAGQSACMASRRILLLPDSLSPGDYSQLQRYLRFEVRE